MLQHDHSLQRSHVLKSQVCQQAVDKLCLHCLSPLLSCEQDWNNLLTTYNKRDRNIRLFYKVVLTTMI